MIMDTTVQVLGRSCTVGRQSAPAADMLPDILPFCQMEMLLVCLTVGWSTPDLLAKQFMGGWDSSTRWASLAQPNDYKWHCFSYKFEYNVCKVCNDVEAMCSVKWWGPSLMPSLLGGLFGCLKKKKKKTLFTSAIFFQPSVFSNHLVAYSVVYLHWSHVEY